MRVNDKTIKDGAHLTFKTLMRILKNLKPPQITKLFWRASNKMLINDLVGDFLARITFLLSQLAGKALSHRASEETEIDCFVLEA